MIKEESYYLWTTGRGLYVLLGLLFFGIFVSPLSIAGGLVSDVMVEFVFAMILLTGVFATPSSIFLRMGMLTIVSLAVITKIFHKFYPASFAMANADNIFAVISLVVFSILIINHFLLNKVVLKYRITAAIAVYLIFGVLWARLYEIVYIFNPASFSLNETINSFSLIYFSFVTLMTLGYGDIVPLSIGARSLAILEGIVGQLYMVILISSLVSEFSALALKKSEEKL